MRLRPPRRGPVPGPLRAWRLDGAALERLRATWASYDGHLVHGDAFRLRARLWRRFPIAARLLTREARHGTVGRRFQLPRPAASLAAQVARLARGITLEGALRPTLLFVQVGRFVEVPRLGFRVGLRRRRLRRRSVVGAPWVAAARLIARALSRGHAVAVALEDPAPAGNVKARHLAYLFEPVAPPGRGIAPPEPTP